MIEIIRVLREPLLRLIRVINADPPSPDFPQYWADALREVKQWDDHVLACR